MGEIKTTTNVPVGAIALMGAVIYAALGLIAGILSAIGLGGVGEMAQHLYSFGTRCARRHNRRHWRPRWWLHCHSNYSSS